MIYSLNGIISLVGLDHIVISVGGIGYLVYTGKSFLARKVGEEVTVQTEMIVKDDKIQLYGFTDSIERKVVDFLTLVNGISYKKAFTILEKISVSNLIQYVSSKNLTSLKSSGIGEKMSSRIIVELADKFIQTFTSIPTSNIQNSLLIEVKSALSNLGYSGAKVDKIIEELLIQDPGIGLEDLIRQCLRLI